MSTFVFGLKAPRPTFAADMTDEEREIMGRHAAYWQPFIDSGQMVIFGPVLDGTGSWGLVLVEADDEDELRAFAAGRSGGDHRDRQHRGRQDARRVCPTPMTCGGSAARTRGPSRRQGPHPFAGSACTSSRLNIQRLRAVSPSLAQTLARPR